MAKQTTRVQVSDMESRLSKLHDDYVSIKGLNTQLTAENVLLRRWAESNGGVVESIVDMSIETVEPPSDPGLDIF